VSLNATATTVSRFGRPCGKTKEAGRT